MINPTSFPPMGAGETVPRGYDYSGLVALWSPNGDTITGTPVVTSTPVGLDILNIGLDPINGYQVNWVQSLQPTANTSMYLITVTVTFASGYVASQQVKQLVQ